MSERVERAVEMKGPGLWAGVEILSLWVQSLMMSLPIQWRLNDCSVDSNQPMKRSQEAGVWWTRHFFSLSSNRAA